MSGEGTDAGIIQQSIQSQRLDCFLIPKPTRSVKNRLTTPEGMFIKAASFGLYPRLRISVAEYVVTTPLETDS